MAGAICADDTASACCDRIIRTLCTTLPPGPVLGSRLEHAASWSPLAHWAAVTGRQRHLVPFDPATGGIDPAAYGQAVTPDTRLATIVHTSQISGMTLDVPAIAAAIRAIAPDCFILVDGVQFAPHDSVSVSDYGIDAYVIAPYKFFAPGGGGFAWLSPRLAAQAAVWEQGSRDWGRYAALSAVFAYLDWLGGMLGAAGGRRARLNAAMRGIASHEAALMALLLQGEPGLPGIAALPGLRVVGPVDSPHRRGILSMACTEQPAERLEEALNAQGIRAYAPSRAGSASHILESLGVEALLRITIGHYNTAEEIRALLAALRRLLL